MYTSFFDAYGFPTKSSCVTLPPPPPPGEPETSPAHQRYNVLKAKMIDEHNYCKSKDNITGDSVFNWLKVLSYVPVASFIIGVFGLIVQASKQATQDKCCFRAGLVFRHLCDIFYLFFITFVLDLITSIGKCFTRNKPCTCPKEILPPAALKV